MLMDGRLHAGDRLPTERDLSQQLGVSRASVREALRVLEIVGLIESRQGDGTYIRDNLANAGFEPLSILFTLQNGTIRDIMEVRLMLETEMAALAARRVTDEQAAAIAELMESFKVELAGKQSEQKGAELDAEIHRTIAGIAGNPLLNTLFNSISMLMNRAISESRKELFKGKEEKKHLAMQHYAICDAIVNKNPQAASQAMGEHLSYVLDRCK